MNTPQSLLAGAGQRLVPLSDPLRFFGSALGFYAAAWLLVALSVLWGDAWRAGLGPSLAALHALTLGVMLSTVMGASLQILPVAARATAWSGHGPGWLWGVHSTGVLMLCAGMLASDPRVLALGAGLTLGAAAVFTARMGVMLARARHDATLLAPTASAILCLALTLVMATSLVAAYLGWAYLPRDVTLRLHVLFAAWGFMALMIASVSTVLLPLFWLGDAPSRLSSRVFLGLAWLALLCAGGAILVGSAWALTLAAGLGLTAAGVHAHALWRSWQGGMRRRADAGLVVMLAGWTGVVLSLVATGIVAVQPSAVPAPLIAALLVGGLTSMVLGVLSRILPFLVSMHRGARRAPSVGLSAQRALRRFAAAHALAWALVLVSAMGAPDEALLVAALAGWVACGSFVHFGLLHLKTLRGSTGVDALITRQR